MMVVLPLICWAIAFLASVDERRSVREAALIAATVVGLATLAFTQLLSPFRALTFGWVAISWAVLAFAVAAACRKRLARGWQRVLHHAAAPWGRCEWLTATALGGFALGTLASALLYPSVNSDSLAYHMPRVFFWFQNHSVAQYPTVSGRQLFASPFAEYAILQLKILARGGDRFGNLVQWVSYLLSVVAASLIAKRLGASRRGQQIAAVAAAATPMAILQASTTQNDLTCAAWSLAVIYLVLDYVDRRPETPAALGRWGLWAGGSIALAIQTKPPAYILCAPFLIWLVVAAVKRDGFARSAAPAGLVVAVVLALVSGVWIDNARLLNGDVIGFSAPGGHGNLLVEDRSPSALVTNALKNLSMELGTPSEPVNRVVERGVRGLVSLYRGDIENPRTMDRNVFEPYAIDHRVAYHDVGPAPVILILAIASAFAVVVSRDRNLSRSRSYVLCATAALFLMAALIGYSYYMNRILLGPLLAFAPVIGASYSAAERSGGRVGRTALVGLTVLAVAWGLPVMLFNSTNRLVPPSLTPVSIGSRDLGYWNTPYADLALRENAPELEEPFRRVAAIADREKAAAVGIDARAGDIVLYPLLVMLSNQHVEYVGATLLQDKIPRDPIAPQLILEIDPADLPLPVDGTKRGEILYGPQIAGSVALTVYRAP